jgi:hypothetical protein
VTVDEKGSVAGVEAVQDFAPFGELLREALRGWTFEPARDQGRAVRSRVLALGFFRPPELAVIAPPRPRYKDTVAPPELPWPTSVTVPPYPPNALGSGKVVLEVEVIGGGQGHERAGPQSRVAVRLGGHECRPGLGLPAREPQRTALRHARLLHLLVRRTTR